MWTCIGVAAVRLAVLVGLYAEHILTPRHDNVGRGLENGDGVDRGCHENNIVSMITKDAERIGKVAVTRDEDDSNRSRLVDGVSEKIGDNHLIGDVLPATFRSVNETDAASLELTSELNLRCVGCLRFGGEFKVGFEADDGTHIKILDSAAYSERNGTTRRARRWGTIVYIPEDRDRFCILFEAISLSLAAGCGGRRGLALPFSAIRRGIVLALCVERSWKELRSDEKRTRAETCKR